MSPPVNEEKMSSSTLELQEIFTESQTSTTGDGGSDTPRSADAAVIRNSVILERGRSTEGEGGKVVKSTAPKKSDSGPRQPLYTEAVQLQVDDVREEEEKIPTPLVVEKRRNNADRYRQEISVQSPLTFEEVKLLQQFLDAVSVLESMDAPLYVEVVCLSKVAGQDAVVEFSARCAGGPTAWITWKADIKAKGDDMDVLYWAPGGSGITDLEGLFTATFKMFGRDRLVYVRKPSQIVFFELRLHVPRQNIVELSDIGELQELQRYHLKAEQCPYHRYSKGWLPCANRSTDAMVKITGNS